ncbi:MAG: PEP/pyruvate-binding domain-containing protein, partial [Haliea sp.]
LDDDQVMALARQAVTIEQHYQRPMDIEWALDGDDGELYIVQARPETVVSQQEGGKLERFQLKEKGRNLISGRAIGQRIGQGAVKVVASPEDMDKVQAGDVLVTDMTDPDWEPMRWTLNDPRRQTFWGHKAPPSWFDEASPVESIETGELMPVGPATLKDRPEFAT